MKNIQFVILIVLLLISTMVLTACDSSITVSKSREDEFHKTTKSEKSCGLGGCETNTKECPIWDRDC